VRLVVSAAGDSALPRPGDDGKRRIRCVGDARGVSRGYLHCMTRTSAMRVIDALVVAGLAASALVQLWSSPSTSLQGDRTVHTLLVVVITLPLLVRRRHPGLVCVAVWSSSWLQYELGAGLGQPFFAGVLALYAVGAHADYPQTLVGPVSAGAVVLTVDAQRLVAGDPLDEVVPVWFVLGGVWGFGRWMRRRRAEAASLTERAERAERDREQASEQAVAEERARIARELHDLVAHSMGVIVIQSQGAQRALDVDPEAARAALGSIEATGRNGLSEMRRLLGLLSDAGPGTSTSPQPSLARLRELVDVVRSTGLAVDLSIAGSARTLPPGVDLAAYRIVQEALTNTLKHAGAANARVAVHYRNDVVEVEVADDGTGPETTLSPGRGLVGMRERVALYEGTLETGASPGGGYVVRARLPVNGSPP
jgi:signal transduction histidine kinase